MRFARLSTRWRGRCAERKESAEQSLSKRTAPAAVASKLFLPLRIDGGLQASEARSFDDEQLLHSGGRCLDPSRR